MRFYSILKIYFYWSTLKYFEKKKSTPPKTIFLTLVYLLGHVFTAPLKKPHVKNDDD